MTNTPRRRCPVCWQTIDQTSHRNIARHWDSVGSGICPASGEPYDIGAPGKRRLFGRTEQVPA